MSSTIRSDYFELIQHFEAQKKPDRGKVGALVYWAVRTVNGIQYLQDLDHVDRSGPNHHEPHPPEIKDICHGRWATTSAITAMDLCAAALGREFGTATGSKENSLADFQTRNRKRRARLPVAALKWIDSVTSDPSYQVVKDARNPFVHSRLIRKFYMGGPTEFHIEGTSHTTAELITLSREVATKHVNTFLDLLPALPQVWVVPQDSRLTRLASRISKKLKRAAKWLDNI